MCTANDAEQYGRRNNIRIRGIEMIEGQTCQTVVKNFLSDKLEQVIEEDDIDIAHVLPTRSQPDTSQPSQSGTGSTTPPPLVIVRFRRREVRDSVLRKRRLLKGTRFTIMEDLTALNSKTLSRVSKDPAVATAWTWNGKILAMLKTGEKITVRPFQSLAC
jgi:hypothetical protein